MQIKKRQLWPISPSTPKKALATRSETEHETVAALSEREKAHPASVRPYGIFLRCSGMPVPYRKSGEAPVCRPADLHGLEPGPAR